MRLIALLLLCLSMTAAKQLPNGVYAVLKEGPAPADVRDAATPHTVLIYERDRHVALDTGSYVPLVLAGPPQAERDDRGHTLLRISLAKEQVKKLEELTRAHLNGRVAVVVDGGIVSIHTVRSVITEGKVMITGCGGDACETLRLKLVK